MTTTSTAEDASVGGASWSHASFKAHFPWLQPLAERSTTAVEEEQKQLEQEAMNQKQQEIVQCLTGNNSLSEEEVDLWHLRQLALTRGGLLSSSLRKRAWPKLVAAHAQVLQHAAKHSKYSAGQSPKPNLKEKSESTAPPSSNIEVSKSDVVMLRKDVAQSVWNVEEHVLVSRYLELGEQEALKLARKRIKRVTFVDMPPGVAQVSPQSDEKQQDTTTDEEEDYDGDKENQHPPAVVMDMDDTPQASNRSIPPPSQSPATSAGTISPFSQVTFDTLSTAKTWNSSSSSSRRKFRRASRQEQKVIFNTIVSVLRTCPPNLDTEEDDRYFYSHGLHDITALLMINLESPSLTHLVLTKLAEYPLRDVLRNPKARCVERIVDATLLTLLKQVDKYLYQHVTSCVEIPSFCLSWVQCWFARDVRDVRAASRILDVCLASHPLMPIYLSVAMLCHPIHRSRILNTDCNVKAMHSVLRNLPKDMIQTNDIDSVMDMLEDMIESALCYMKKYPPGRLVQHPPGGLSSFQPPPEWATASVAPTDYALLQHARALRTGTTISLEAATNRRSTASHYDLAMTAVGVPVRRIRLAHWRALVAVGAMTVLLVAYKFHGGALLTGRAKLAGVLPSMSARSTRLHSSRLKRSRSPLVVSTPQRSKLTKTKVLKKSSKRKAAETSSLPKTNPSSGAAKSSRSSSSQSSSLQTSLPDGDIVHHTVYDYTKFASEKIRVVWETLQSIPGGFVHFLKSILTRKHDTAEKDKAGDEVKVGRFKKFGRFLGKGEME